MRRAYHEDSTLHPALSTCPGRIGKLFRTASTLLGPLWRRCDRLHDQCHRPGGILVAARPLLSRGSVAHGRRRGAPLPNMALAGAAVFAQGDVVRATAFL